MWLGMPWAWVWASVSKQARSRLQPCLLYMGGGRALTPSSMVRTALVSEMSSFSKNAVWTERAPPGIDWEIYTWVGYSVWAVSGTASAAAGLFCIKPVPDCDGQPPGISHCCCVPSWWMGRLWNVKMASCLKGQMSLLGIGFCCCWPSCVLVARVSPVCPSRNSIRKKTRTLPLQKVVGYKHWSVCVCVCVFVHACVHTSAWTSGVLGRNYTSGVIDLKHFLNWGCWLSDSTILINVIGEARKWTVLGEAVVCSVSHGEVLVPILAKVEGWTVGWTRGCMYRIITGRPHFSQYSLKYSPVPPPSQRVLLAGSVQGETLCLWVYASILRSPVHSRCNFPAINFQWEAIKAIKGLWVIEFGALLLSSGNS